MGEQPVVLDRGDVEVHAVVGDVGAADRRPAAPISVDHLLDVVGGVGDVGRAGRRRCRPSPRHHTASQRWAISRRVAALVVGPVDDLVVDVGDVRDEPDLEARSTRGSGAGCRRRASPGRGRGGAGRRRWGRRGRCSPVPGSRRASSRTSPVAVSYRRSTGQRTWRPSIESASIRWGGWSRWFWRGIVARARRCRARCSTGRHPTRRLFRTQCVTTHAALSRRPEPQGDPLHEAAPRPPGPGHRAHRDGRRARRGTGPRH